MTCTTLAVAVWDKSKCVISTSVVIAASLVPVADANADEVAIK